MPDLIQKWEKSTFANILNSPQGQVNVTLYLLFGDLLARPEGRPYLTRLFRKTLDMLDLPDQLMSLLHLGVATRNSKAVDINAFL
jgi:hypothetical protein